MKKPVLTIPYPIYTMDKVKRIMSTTKALDLTGADLIDKALDEYMTKQGF